MSFCAKMLMRKKYGLFANLDFNPPFNLTNFSCIQRICSTSREKKTSKHGFNIVLRLWVAVRDVQLCISMSSGRFSMDFAISAVEYLFFFGTQNSVQCLWI